MASFEELQALAAARSQASQAKLAAERAKRESEEKAKRLALESKARADAQREREALIAREHKRKREEEQRKQLETERQKRAAQRQMELARQKVSQQLDVAKFRKASQKAIIRAGGSLNPKNKKKDRSSSSSSSHGRRREEDSVSPPPHMREHSTLTREEKRKRKEAAMLGLSTSSTKRKTTTSPQAARDRAAAAIVGDLVRLGTQKRDLRSVDEIERDLIAARKAKQRLQEQGVGGTESDRIEEEQRREKELEVMLRRQRAMQAKRSVQGQADNGIGGSSSGYHDEHPDPSSNASERGGKRNCHSAIGNLSSSSPTPKQSSAPSKKDYNGLNPADFLPGAPIKKVPIAMQPKKVEDKQLNGNAKRLRVEKAVAEPAAGPVKKETRREAFLRAEAERKRLQSLNAGQDDDEDDEDDSDNEDDDDEDDSEEEEEEEYETEEEEEPHRGCKRAKVSEEIWKLFNRRDKSEYLARDVDSDDEDMEADMESVRREEERSARLARLEDKREEEELRRREQEKARRKALKK